MNNSSNAFGGEHHALSQRASSHHSRQNRGSGHQQQVEPGAAGNAEMNNADEGHIHFPHVPNVLAPEGVDKWDAEALRQLLTSGHAIDCPQWDVP